MTKQLILIIIIAGIFFGVTFLLIFLLPNEVVEQNKRADRPFFAVGDAFEDIITIKSEDCLDLVETINNMNPGDQRVELYKMWLENCIESQPAIPSLP